MVMKAEKGCLSLIPGVGELRHFTFSQFNNRRVEIIVLTADEPVAVRRRPHPHIAGRVQINGDILGSVPEIDWDLPR